MSKSWRSSSLGRLWDTLVSISNYETPDFSLPPFFGAFISLFFFPFLPFANNIRGVALVATPEGLSAFTRLGFKSLNDSPEDNRDGSSGSFSARMVVLNGNEPFLPAK